MRPRPLVDREALESRVLTELPERMMTPGIAAEAMRRAYAQETNRLNRQRRSSSESTRPELAEDAKAIAKIVRVIGQCGWHRVG
jgi:site-specific DNA recombinase